MLFADYKTAPTTVFRLPYRDNLQDNCTVLATGNGHVDAGFTPIKLSTAAIAMVDLMLLPDTATFDFLQWGARKTQTVPWPVSSLLAVLTHKRKGITMICGRISLLPLPRF